MFDQITGHHGPDKLTYKSKHHNLLAWVCFFSPNLFLAVFAAILLGPQGHYFHEAYLIQNLVTIWKVSSSHSSFSTGSLSNKALDHRTYFLFSEWRFLCHYNNRMGKIHINKPINTSFTLAATIWSCVNVSKVQPFRPTKKKIENSSCEARDSCNWVIRKRKHQINTSSLFMREQWF